MSSVNPKKRKCADERKAVFDRKCKRHKTIAMRHKRRLVEVEKRLYFDECFDALDFDECDRLYQDDRDDEINYLDEKFMSRASRAPLLDQWAWLLEGPEVSPDQRYRSGNQSWTVLTQAATHGNTEVCKLLLKHDASVNERTINGAGWTALITAADDGNLELCKLLVNAGASVDMESTNRLVASEIANANGHTDVVAYLRPLER